MRIEELESDVELLHRVPLRAATDFPEGVVGVAVVAGVRPDRGEVSDEPRERSGAYRPGYERRVENRRGIAVVIDAGVAADQRRLPAWIPDVLIGRLHAPGAGQLDLGAGREDAVGDPADRDARGGIVKLRHPLTGAEGGRAIGVAHIDADLVAAWQVQLAAGLDCPAEPVGRVAIVDVVGKAV